MYSCRPGGVTPHDERDAKELYYLSPDGKLIAVEITPGARIESGIPRELFDAGLGAEEQQGGQYAVTPDGQRFLLLKPLTEAAPMPITVVLNWTASLRK
jgi:hypothetical protein